MSESAGERNRINESPGNSMLGKEGEIGKGRQIPCHALLHSLCAVPGSKIRSLQSAKKVLDFSLVFPHVCSDVYNRQERSMDGFKNISHIRRWIVFHGKQEI